MESLLEVLQEGLKPERIKFYSSKGNRLATYIDRIVNFALRQLSTGPFQQNLLSTERNSIHVACVCAVSLVPNPPSSFLSSLWPPQDTAAVQSKIMALLSGLPIMVMDSIYQVASTRVGQHAISFIDRLLCIVEALNFFSAPQEQQQAARHESKELTDYKRPLPWLLFLPLLCYCRVVRVMLSIILYPFNKEISAITAVYYIQKMRRDLRYIKIQGARRMADPEQKISSLPWPLQLALSVFTWGPLQFFTIVGRLVFGDKQYNVYSTTGQPRSVSI